jgi:hypothetical protein
MGIKQGDIPDTNTRSYLISKVAVRKVRDERKNSGLAATGKRINTGLMPGYSPKHL